MSNKIISNSNAPSQGLDDQGVTAQGVTDQIGEQLSALMDGELAHDQVRFLLRSVEAESDLARRWSSYHVISATLRREFVVLPLRTDFSANVLERLGVDGAGAASTGRAQRNFGALRWLGGGAIAAAVAVVALVVSRPISENGVPANVTALSAPASGSVIAQTLPAAIPSRPVYLPLQPAGFDTRNVMPASDDSPLSSYYSPDGSVLPRDYFSNGAAPYVLYVNPQTRRLDSPLPVQSGARQK